MRVLFLTNTPVPYRVAFFNELGKYCELTVLFETEFALDRNPAWKSKQDFGFDAVFMKGKRVGVADAFCPEVIRYLSDKKFDVIVVGVYSSPTGMLAIEYMRLHRIPFILSSDGGVEKADSEIKRSIKKHFISAASMWLSTGKTTTEYLIHYGADPKRIYVYPFTSIEENYILQQPLTGAEKQEYRKPLGMKEEKIVLSVGQFIYRKGYDILLKACKELDDSVGVYIVGGKPTEEYLELKEELNLKNVHFVDFMTKDKLANYYKAADLFVLPTREDIWGLVINEAMAYGLPVITTDKCVAGIEMVENGVNGFIVSVDNVRQLQDKISEILMDDSLQMKMAKNSLTKAKEYTIEKMCEAHMSCFVDWKRRYQYVRFFVDCDYHM